MSFRQQISAKLLLIVGSIVSISFSIFQGLAPFSAVQLQAVRFDLALFKTGPKRVTLTRQIRPSLEMTNPACFTFSKLFGIA